MSNIRRNVNLKSVESVRKRLQFGTEEDSEEDQVVIIEPTVSSDHHQSEFVVFTQGKQRRSLTRSSKKMDIVKLDQNTTTVKSNPSLLETSPLYGREEERIIKRPVSPLLLWSEMDFSPKFINFADDVVNESFGFEFSNYSNLSNNRDYNGQCLIKSSNSTTGTTTPTTSNEESFFHTQFESIMIN